MKEPITLIMPAFAHYAHQERLVRVLDAALDGVTVERMITHVDELHDVQGKRLLFLLTLGEEGINLPYLAMLQHIRRNPELFAGSVGAVVIDALSELYTKSVGRELVFAANMAGCAFVGRPLCEATDTLQNFTIRARIGGTDHEGAYVFEARRLLERLCAEQVQPPIKSGQNVVVLHASSHEKSNTFALWDMVKENLRDSNVREIGLRNGVMVDCSGCPYTLCRYFAESRHCLYGGVMSEQVYPAMETCDTLVMLAPNYNDALSANLTACINRLTAMMHRQQFYNQRLFALVVSGYSGGDIVAGQLIAALNMNKTFFLPAYFCMTETAHEAGSVFHLPGIAARAADFAARIEGRM